MIAMQSKLFTWIKNAEGHSGAWLRGYGRTITYIPIGQLSPVALKKVRVVHVLDGYDKRESAKEFLW